MEFIKKNQDAFTSGILAVAIGFLGKTLLKMDLLPVKGGKQILSTFFVISAAGIGANEIKEKYPVK